MFYSSPASCGAQLVEGCCSQTRGCIFDVSPKKQKPSSGSGEGAANAPETVPVMSGRVNMLYSTPLANSSKLKLSGRFQAS